MNQRSPDETSTPDPLTHLCDGCRTAFAADTETCPNCESVRPDDGWRLVRDYPDAWLGRTVGERYQLLQRLGEGTFGAVYRASRPHLDDTYAVKIIRLDNADLEADGPSLRDRVEREVQILSSISSPHIVNFHDYIELAGGAVGVIMDFVRGDTLRELLVEEDRLELSRTIQFAIETATGLREVHQRGVVHRDLKPDNVMVQSLGHRGEFIELIDFGVARFENEVRRTQGFVGTPRYTSPEQARGEDADRRSDIYNLGMLLFHMLTGQPPFTSDNVNELLQAHSSAEPPDMSDIAPDQEIPEPLESLVQSMLKKPGEERPDNMEVVLRVLKPIRKKLEEARRHPSNVGSDREKYDSLPPSFSTDFDQDFGARHDTDDHHPIDEEDGEEEEQTEFSRRPPSDVYTVAEEGRIIYCDDENTIRIQVAKGDDVSESELVTLDESVTSVACENPDWVIIGQEHGAVAAFAVDTREVETIMEDGDLGAVTSVATDESVDQIVAGFGSGAVRLGRPEAPESQWDAVGHGAPVVSVAMHHDGSCIAVSRENATTDVYLPGRSRKAPTTTVDHDEVPDSVDFSPDGYLVAVRHEDGTVRLFSALTGAHVSDSPRSVLQASSVFEDESFRRD